jgi:hypothetical protein
MRFEACRLAYQDMMLMLCWRWATNSTNTQKVCCAAYEERREEIMYWTAAGSSTLSSQPLLSLLCRSIWAENGEQYHSQQHSTTALTLRPAIVRLDIPGWQSVKPCLVGIEITLLIAPWSWSWVEISLALM